MVKRKGFSAQKIRKKRISKKTAQIISVDNIPKKRGRKKKEVAEINRSAPWSPIIWEDSIDGSKITMWKAGWGWRVDKEGKTYCIGKGNIEEIKELKKAAKHGV